MTTSTTSNRVTVTKSVLAGGAAIAANHAGTKYGGKHRSQHYCRKASRYTLSGGICCKALEKCRRIGT
jgi:hypothetical protein